ncbi:hypothetical protein PQU92_15005 [Asticcacaulis sp. BYS171W]|uniref:Uncharacterized protein n=1 Tax=Asticcacaulis aquaticus TaxID=2984212 RepID=A0ABT5HXD6_9CAUL|nr:hypothetical protein [Asticcacaulis aquaticus]MDC7684592.1 hypothetical protein [Asticcacaulis aquaticus]
MFRYLAPAFIMAACAGQAVALCPGTDVPGAPLLPAVTAVEFYNAAVPAKPLKAVATTETDRMQVTGGVVGKGSLTLNLTLSSEVAAGCELSFSLFDAATPINGQRQTATEQVFPAINVHRNYLRVMSNGTNKVQVTLPVGIRLGNSAIHRHRIGLSSLRVNQTPETPQTFEFRNNPIQIKEIRRISPTAASVRDGDRVEMAVYLQEPLDVATYEYDLLPSLSSEYRSNSLRVEFTISPSDAAYLLPRETRSYVYFRPEFADGSSRTGLMIDVPEAPASKELKKKTETPLALPGRLTLPKSDQTPTTITITAQLSTYFSGPGGQTLTLQIPVN